MLVFSDALSSLSIAAVVLAAGGGLGCAATPVVRPRPQPVEKQPACPVCEPCQCEQNAAVPRVDPASDPGAAEAGQDPSERFGLFRWRSSDRSLAEIAASRPRTNETQTALRRTGRFRQTQLIRVGQTHLVTADVTDDGAYVLAVSEAEALVRVYSAGGALLSRFAVTGLKQFGRGSFSFFPGGGRPRVLVGTEQGIALYDGLSGEFLSRISEVPTWDMRFALGKRVLIASQSDIGTQSSYLTFFELLAEGGLEKLAELSSDERIDGMDLSEDGRLLAVSTYPSDSVQLIDLENRSVLWSVRGPQYVGAVDISPDGSLVAAGGDRLVIFDARDPSRRAELAVYGNNLHAVAFLDRNDEIATTSYDGALRIVSVDQDKPDLRLVQTLRHGGTANVYTIVVRKGGDELLTSSGDKTVRRFGRKLK